MPMTPFSGVRTSCETVVRNRVLAASAATARSVISASRAVRSATRSSSSALCAATSASARSRSRLTECTSWQVATRRLR